MKKFLTFKIFALSVLVTMTAGCSTQSAIPANDSFECSNSTDCASKMSKALNWVVENSYFKIQNQSDELIQTYGPIQNEIWTAYTISLIKNDDGTGDIVFQASCGNWIGCNPAPQDAEQSFASAIGK